MTLTEAAACGTPAVATRIAGHRDAVDDGVSGLLVDSVDELVGAAGRVIDDAMLRRRLSLGAERATPSGSPGAPRPRSPSTRWRTRSGGRATGDDRRTGRPPGASGPRGRVGPGRTGEAHAAVPRLRRAAGRRGDHRGRRAQRLRLGAHAAQSRGRHLHGAPRGRAWPSSSSSRASSSTARSSSPTCAGPRSRPPAPSGCAACLRIVPAYWVALTASLLILGDRHDRPGRVVGLSVALPLRADLLPEPTAARAHPGLDAVRRDELLPRPPALRGGDRGAPGPARSTAPPPRPRWAGWSRSWP